MAFIHLQESVRLNKSQLHARGNLANLYEELGKYSESVKQYREILKLFPDFKTAKMHHNVGVLYHKMKKYDEAIEEYTIALNINPELLLTPHNLALSYFKKGLVARAITTMEASLNLGYLPSKFESGLSPSQREYIDFLDFNTSNVYEVYTRLGVLYSKYRLYDAAKKAFQMFINLKPDSADGYYNLGVVYWKQGDFAQASRLWRRTLDIDPSHILAKEWLKNLKKINK